MFEKTAESTASATFRSTHARYAAFAAGRCTGLRDGAHGPLEELAVSAAEAIGLQPAAGDIFDCSEAGDGSDLVVIEVNSNPMIATLEENDRWDLITDIWRANFAAAVR